LHLKHGAKAAHSSHGPEALGKVHTRAGSPGRSGAILCGRWSTRPSGSEGTCRMGRPPGCGLLHRRLPTSGYFGPPKAPGLGLGQPCMLGLLAKRDNFRPSSRGEWYQIWLKADADSRHPTGRPMMTPRGAFHSFEHRCGHWGEGPFSIPPGNWHGSDIAARIPHA